MSVTSTFSPLNFLTASRPAKPPPTTTTFGRLEIGRATGVVDAGFRTGAAVGGGGSVVTLLMN